MADSICSVFSNNASICQTGSSLHSFTLKMVTIYTHELFYNNTWTGLHRRKHVMCDYYTELQMAYCVYFYLHLICKCSPDRTRMLSSVEWIKINSPMETCHPVDSQVKLCNCGKCVLNLQRQLWHATLSLPLAM